MGALLIFQVILLGIVEGLTEFIPVSSTAHLLLVGQGIGISSGPFLGALSISIQSGAVLAVIWYFWKTLWSHRSLFWKIAVAFIPTAIAGLLLYPLIKSFFDSTTIIAWALIIGGLALIFITPKDESTDVATISYRQAFFIGLSQIASFIPGISRAGATLIGGTLLRIPRALIVSFSFMLAIPTILGATVVEMRHIESLSSSQWYLIIIGIVVAFLVALMTIKFFITFLTKKPLSWFGWYRIVLGVLLLILIA